MKVAVMQPYIFPYIGYFQLISAADVFVFADDLNYIKGGWINRNKILLENKASLMSFPCLKKSQNKLIYEVQIEMESKAYLKNLLTIKRAYIKAPYFKEVFPLIELCFNGNFKNIAELASFSVVSVSKYLGLKTDFLYTTTSFGHTKGQEKSNRLINITKELGSSQYINPIGGKDLYDPHYFASHGVKLNFLDTQFISYKQYNNDFIRGLSIIDVLMFNSVEEVKTLLNSYRFV